MHLFYLGFCVLVFISVFNSLVFFSEFFGYNERNLNIRLFFGW